MYLGIILTEQVEDLYNKNFEIFKKSVKMSEDESSPMLLDQRD